MINSRVLDSGFKTVQIDITTEKDFITTLGMLQEFKEYMESVNTFSDNKYSFEQRCIISDLVRELGYHSG